jgi:DNA processing protein
MGDNAYWVALAMTGGVGPRTFAALLERFGTPRAVFAATEEELSEVARVTPEIVAGLRAVELDQIENELYTLDEEGISLLTLEDERYPANLRRISDAPPVLFVRGTLKEEDVRAVALVGTREPSEWGARVAAQLARGFAERGFTVVSGLARGIDTAVHTGALEGEGRTLAVLGSGIRVIHPKRNDALAAKIAAGNGAILSEFHPNAAPQGTALMMRDRVISGLARGVIVVEAAPASGSLDTAGRARKQKRALFAVRGGGQGAESLIRSGADVVEAENIDWEGIIGKLEVRDQDPPPASSQQLPLL